MTAAPDSKLATFWCPSPNRDQRTNGRTPDMLILHYTGMESSDGALDWLTRKEAKVSAHYLVDEEGRIAQLVTESERAWHAGQSRWAGETDLNSCSIGVEIHQPVRHLKKEGEYFVCTDFRKPGSKDEYYDIDFWVNQKSGKLEVGNVKIHKVPVQEDGVWTQQPRYTFEGMDFDVTN